MIKLIVKVRIFFSSHNSEYQRNGLRNIDNTQDLYKQIEQMQQQIKELEKG